MITEYHRPLSIDEAIKLLARPEVSTYALAGGAVINQPSPEPMAVVDLQALGLNSIMVNGNTLEIGATTTLQSLLDQPDIPPALDTAIRQETNFNVRQVASIAGSLIAADGRSTLATLMLALDAQLTLEPNGEQVGLGDLLPTRGERIKGRLVTQISIPLNIKTAFEYIARTPADLPVVCVSAAQWSSGRTRVAIGGWGAAPRLVMDGSESAGAEVAARNASSDAGDAWASADYRQEMAMVLTARCIKGLESSE